MAVESEEIKSGPHGENSFLRFSLSDRLTFILPSLLGVFLFIIPFSYENSFTIAVAAIASFLQKSLATYLPLLITMTISISFVLSFFSTLFLTDKKNEKGFRLYLQKHFRLPYLWLFIRGVAAIFSLMAFTSFGWEGIISEKTGGLLLRDLLPTIFCMFVTAGFLLSLLIDFGLLEFVGVLASKIMRPLFKLPGRASVDCLASWLGDGTIGILLTNLQYVEGHYTEREASVIATTFSFVSLSFSIVILAQLNLMNQIFPFYLAIIIVGLCCAVILPRVPPLSRKKEEYYAEPAKDDTKLIPQNFGLFRWALFCAFNRAKKQKSIGTFFRGGIQNVSEMWFGVIPVVMMFGTIALIFAEYTPLFRWCGLPFVTLLEWLRIPNAADLSQAVVVGFADMFLPAIFVSSVESELSRFVIAALSVSQLIFMSEVGGLIMGSKIPISFVDLLIIFLSRTLIALPIVSLIGHYLL